MDDAKLSRLREMLSYNPATGVFTWLKKVGSKSAGSKAGSVWRSPSGSGPYLIIRFERRGWQAQVLAHWMMTGVFPTGEMDHADNDGLNNKWLNLRHSTKSQNQANAKVRRDSTTGIKGVSFRQGRGWVARIQCDGKRYDLGQFPTAQMASEAYANAAKEKFGEFARVS